MMGWRITFARKVALLMIALMVATGTIMTGVTAYQFRKDLVREEARSAFTVYLSVINYLAGHYKTHRSRFVPHILDYVLDERFLNVAGMTEAKEAPRLLDLVILDDRREPIYTYTRDEGGSRIGVVEFLEAPRYFSVRLLSRDQLLYATGPISPDGEVPGSVAIILPTQLQQKIRGLYIKAAATLGSVALLGVLLSLAFSQRVLAPIRALTTAAGRMREGDLTVRIEKAPPDEIGELAQTFNQMVSTISRRLDTMERIHDWTLELGKEFSLPKLLTRIGVMFREMSGAEFSMIGGVSAQGTLERLAGDPRDTVDTPRLGEKDVEALGKAQAIRVGGSTGEGSGLLVLPMLQEAKGAMVVVLRMKEDLAADPEHTTLLANLAQNAGLIVENARLYAEVSEKQRIQQEMSWARQIQQSLLPRTVPQFMGYEAFGLSRPAREVGGDYYDFISLEGSLHHVIIGDVSGKGVPAGLIMSVVRSLVHTYCEFETSPDAILTRVNRSLTQDLDPDMFVTATMLTLNTDDHVVRMVRAGHEPALRIRPGGEIEELQPGGAALGLTDVGHFDRCLEQVEVPFEPGDLLILFTDGLTEARASDGREFGLDRLKETLFRLRDADLPVIIQEIFRDLQDFTAGAEQSDDITLLALRRIP
ncbi:MAG TPA: SpoIIE family protein phosphatase [Kiritimatiellia bacterium]|nr:SpoIIE family protein phosphatase [Kiritimatiellia bacterium]